MKINQSYFKHNFLYTISLQQHTIFDKNLFYDEKKC